jgi:hypothetical protein
MLMTKSVYNIIKNLGDPFSMRNGSPKNDFPEIRLAKTQFPRILLDVIDNNDFHKLLDTFVGLKGKQL